MKLPKKKLRMPKGWKSPEEMQKEWAEKIKAAGVATEKEMHAAPVPSIKDFAELEKYLGSLVDRPHDYGTCVHAMSMAAVAAFNLVASKLGVTGFQASCAQIDFLRRTRGWEWGQILDFDKLLYPQTCDEEHFPGWHKLVNEHRVKLAEKAAALLASSHSAAPHVREHWESLVRMGRVTE